MIIYSFDTGESTGVAKLDTDSYDLVLQTVSSREFLGILEDKEFNPEQVVVERIPDSSKFELLLLYKEVSKVCHSLGIFCTSIAPSQWKPLRDGRKWKCTQSSTTHEADAYNLLRYYLITNFFWDIGDI